MNQKPRLSVFFHALPVSILVLSCFYYWFALADRYIVFLYHHDMGPFVSDTSPFSAVTGSRYWMAGLVAGGMVMVLYTGGTWLLGRLLKAYQPPRWWQVWLVACGPLLIGLPLITMLTNTPRLPLLNALQVTLATIVSVGLALLPAQTAAKQPWALTLLALDGWAMAALMLGLSMLDRVAWLSERNLIWPLLIVGGGFVGAVVVFLVTTWIHIWRGIGMPDAPALFIAGLAIAYLLLPLTHHLIGTDGYYYITDKDNFFSWRWSFQGVAWLVTGAITVGVTRLRRYLAR